MLVPPLTRPVIGSILPPHHCPQRRGALRTGHGDGEVSAPAAGVHSASALRSPLHTGTCRPDGKSCERRLHFLMTTYVRQEPLGTTRLRVWSAATRLRYARALHVSEQYF